ncbi:MAG: hypothetical protein AB1918_07820 [Pseudomonadota bacterium]
MRGMTMVAAAVAVVLMLSGWPALAGEVARDQLVEAASMPGLLNAKDFKPFDRGIRAQRPDKGILVTFLGPAKDVQEVIAVGGVAETNGLALMLTIPSLVATGAQWDDGATWASQSISALAKSGGTATKQVNGRIIELTVVQPNVIHLSIVKR